MVRLHSNHYRLVPILALIVLALLLLLSPSAQGQQGQTETAQERRIQHWIEVLAITADQESDFRAAMQRLREQRMAALRSRQQDRQGQQGRQGRPSGRVGRDQSRGQQREQRRGAMVERGGGERMRPQPLLPRAQVEEIFSEVLSEEQMARFLEQRRE